MTRSKKRRAPATVRPYGRIKLIGAGLVLALVGTARAFRGVQVVIHSNLQPVFSWGLIAGGGLCILLALIPSLWIVKAATTHPK
jgi:hypothetical protein